MAKYGIYTRATKQEEQKRLRPNKEEGVVDENNFYIIP